MTNPAIAVERINAQQRKILRISTTVLLLVLSVFGPRLYQLGTVLTIDEPLWVDRGRTFFQAISTFHFANTVPSIQPGVTTAWLTGVASIFNTLAAAQASVAIASSLLILSATYFAVLIFGKRYGLLFGLLLALDPFLIAHGRVAHTDSLLALSLLNASFALLVAGYARTSALRGQARYYVYSGFFCGVGVLTKIFALAFWPLAFAIIAIPLLQTRQWRLIFTRYGLWLGITILTIYSLWPALWVDAGQVISHIATDVTTYADGTREQEVTNQWWYYLRETFVRITPITSIFGVAGLMVALKNFRERQNQAVLLLLAAAVMYAVILSLRGEKGDRYILFSMISLIGVATIGLQATISWLRREWHGQEKVLFAAISTIAVIFLATQSIRLHPHQLAYHNQLYPFKQYQKFGWGEGLEEAAAWVNVNHPDWPVRTFYPRVFTHFYTGTADVESQEHEPNTRPSLIVLYRAMLERGPDAPETDALNNYLFADVEPLHVVTINNLPYVWIYQRIPGK